MGVAERSTSPRRFGLQPRFGDAGILGRHVSAASRLVRVLCDTLALAHSGTLWSCVATPVDPCYPAYRLHGGRVHDVVDSATPDGSAPTAARPRRAVSIYHRAAWRRARRAPHVFASGVVRLL